MSRRWWLGSHAPLRYEWAGERTNKQLKQVPQVSERVSESAEPRQQKDELIANTMRLRRGLSEKGTTDNPKC
jgi:hypothetical protein